METTLLLSCFAQETRFKPPSSAKAECDDVWCVARGCADVLSLIVACTEDTEHIETPDDSFQQFAYRVKQAMREDSEARLCIIEIGTIA